MTKPIPKGKRVIIVLRDGTTLAHKREIQGFYHSRTPLGYAFIEDDEARLQITIPADSVAYFIWPDGLPTFSDDEGEIGLRSLTRQIDSLDERLDDYAERLSDVEDADPGKVDRESIRHAITAVDTKIHTLNAKVDQIRQTVFNRLAVLEEARSQTETTVVERLLAIQAQASTLEREWNGLSGQIKERLDAEHGGRNDRD